MCLKHCCKAVTPGCLRQQVYLCETVQISGTVGKRENIWALLACRELTSFILSNVYSEVSNR